MVSPRCFTPQREDTLKPPVFSWRARQTWRRGPSNAAARRQRAPPPSQNSLVALQVWQNCPQIRHRERQERRCGVSSQRWSAGVTPPPLIARIHRQRLLLPPGKRSRIVSLFCMSRAIAAHAVIKSPLNVFQNPSCSQRILHIALTSHVARLVELHTAHYDPNCFRNSYSQRKLRTGRRNVYCASARAAFAKQINKGDGHAGLTGY